MCRHMFKHVLSLVLLLCIVGIDAVGKQPRGAVDEAPLLDQLLEQLCLGRGSCKKVTELARASLKPASLGLRRVAKIKSGKNAERALQTWANKQAWRKLLPDLYTFPIALSKLAQDSTDTGKTHAEHAALLPHEVFGSLHSYAPDLFDHLLTGGGR